MRYPSIVTAISFTLLLTVSAPLDATLSARTPADPPFTHQASDIKADERVVYGVLDNGLRYAVMRNSTPSGVAAVRMRIDTGSLNETEEQQGLAHFLEHMAFNGSTNVPEGEMVKRLERYGLAFGADTNASTGFDQTTYKLNLPTVEDEVLDEAFFIMRETASNLTLDPDAIERERGVIASEKLARDSIRFRSFVDRLRFFTQGSGLTDRLPIGIDETIASMPRDEFVSYYRGYYRPENTFIAVIGDLDPADAIARIERYFGDWEPVGEPLPTAELSLADIQPGRVGVYTDEGLNTSLTIAALRPYVDRADTKAHRRERLLLGLGSLILNERMRRKVNAGTAAYLNAANSWYSVDDVVEGMTLNVQTAPDDWQAALADGEQELRRALLHGFSQDELDEQIAKVRQSRETSVERASTRKTYAGGFEFSYANAIVDAFANDRVFNSPETSLALFEEAVAGLAVDEVEGAFRAAWAGIETPKLYFVSGSPPEGGEKALRTALAESREVAVAPPAARRSAAFAYTDYGQPGNVVSEVYNEDADAYLIKFANNVRLNFKHTDFDAGTILVRARVGEGFLSMPEKSEGLRRLGLNVLKRSGVAAHTADEIRSIFAGRRVGMIVRTRPSDDAFDLLGTTGREDLGAQLNLMTAKVSAPAFRDEIVEQHYKRMKAWYPTHESSLQQVADKYLPRLIRSGDRRYGHDDLDSFLAPSVEDVRAWMEPQFRDGLIEVTIVGDVEKQVVVDEVARTFGALPERADAKQPFANMRSLVFPQNTPGPHVFHHKGNVEQALVFVYWPGPDASDPAEQHRMRLLRGVFRNRLTEVLREEMGATYSPGVANYSSSLFEGYGYIYTRVTATPDEVDKVREGIMRVASEMAREGVSVDAFERAQTPLVEDLNSTLENNSYWMNVLRDAQTDGVGLAAFRVREDTYRNATVAEINALAARVFHNEKSVTAYILPQSDRE